ncbi:S1 family peptidase [Arthrobacter russicus]|uniref:Secreted trypsin-like serine protease n=1 Tax=Arthrobacter russicus TaxID=172040 RepID=A0ABU1JEP0_9MICC|nr:S1 family peptidase [Arthrobacter russicus]MDR6270331.1 secreted trypsin-like serine protease [Arthrobacter russicus]
MNKIFKSVLVGAAAASMAFLGTGAASAAPVAGGGATPDIVGGTKAPATAWEVQLIFVQNGGTYGCTGEAISADWILTANHCIDGDTSMNVYYSNSTTNRGTAIKADKWVTSGKGDVALVHLSQSKNLGSYPALADSYTATSGDAGKIMGYGRRANAANADGLYQANVTVIGKSTDAYRGTAVHIKGVDGAANHGDSGGPLIVGGKIVGVCSTGDDQDPGANTQAGSNYANLTASRSWIKSTSGV